ncbi:Prenylcysteine lyase-domain-containing protein [Cubamyces menziesii]|uniref:Prenylcysteine lyase domain-containing protein n=1 Tax=Trametes cubensis TaxID=1111947 RepID=A0AAD7TVI3_9APHY|nr:Prenylcysteine lyase-domain-containing protein [Cubamyces menziesii]KAJ8481426.1 hypothetical protein ONZ51_g6013 [Trametes cubensis]
MFFTGALSAAAYLVLVVGAQNFEYPQEAPSDLEVQTPIFFTPINYTSATNRVAIIGAGAAGSSAAFWIGKAKERYGVDVEIDVYDRNPYVGGRSTVVQPYDMPELEPVELGGSVFVEVNKNLWRAVDEFGFERIPFENASDVVGIWDGQEFVAMYGGPGWYSGWLGKAKLLWKYGYHAISKTQSLVKEISETILTLYAPVTHRFKSISELASNLNWDAIASHTTADYLDSQGVNPSWTREMVEAATRINYGQNVDDIHALEGFVSLAAARPSSIKGGNFQIFEQFLAQSKASLHLNTTVSAVSRTSLSDPWLVKTTGSEDPKEYRAVILAAPYHQSNIIFSSPELPIARVPKQPYAHLHVTILSTSSRYANSIYFNLSPVTPVPEMVLTTYNGARKGGPAPEFNSLSYLTQLRYKNGTAYLNAQGNPEWIVKVFSYAPISDDWLSHMFGGKVGWVLRKEWDAYPVLPPTTEFPPIKLADGLYYVNAFEPLISTMETETIASRNIVDIMLREHFRSGICRTHTLGASLENFVYGWDC